MIAPTTSGNPTSPTREAWIERFKKRLIDRAATEADFAHDCAEAWLETVNGDLGESPEDCADEEIEAWAADC